MIRRIRFARTCACLALAATCAASVLPSAQADTAPVHYGAIATHPALLDVWLFGGGTGPGSEESLKKRALEACTKAMGTGCVAETWMNDHIVLSRNGLGLARISQAATRELALADARQGCDERWQLPCEILVSFSARDRRHFADPIKNRKTHGFAVWVKTASGEVDPRAWIATGYRTGAEARDAAMSACTAQSGGKACEEVASVTNGVLQALTDGKFKVGFVAESSVERARGAMQLVCKTNRETECTPQIAYASHRPGIYVHDFSSGNAQ